MCAEVIEITQMEQPEPVTERAANSGLNDRAAYGEARQNGFKSGFEIVTNWLIDDGNMERSNLEMLIRDDFRHFGGAYIETYPLKTPTAYVILGDARIEGEVAATRENSLIYGRGDVNSSLLAEKPLMSKY